MIAYDQLSQIIPPDQALANKALATSMSWITGISSLTLPKFAAIVANVQTTSGLPLISSQTSPVSAESANIILSTLATGTGQNGTITLSDLLGTAAGTVSANVMINTVSTINSLNLANLTAIYNYMLNTVNGDYGPLSGPIVIPTGPAHGTYSNANVAFTGNSGNTSSGIGLIPSAQHEIANVISSYPKETTSLNDNWASIMRQLNLEATNQKMANLNFNQLIGNSTTSIYGFVFALPTYGMSSQAGGPNQYLQAVANTDTLSGQAIIATLRQGQSNLKSTAIGTNSQIPGNPNPLIPQATLSSSQYTYP
jgi:hypothetical protein